jgi:hypothetical protein
MKTMKSELDKIDSMVTGMLGIAYANKEIATRLYGWDSEEVTEAERMIEICMSGIHSALDKGGS